MSTLEGFFLRVSVSHVLPQGGWGRTRHVAQRALVMVHCTRQNTLETIQTHHSSHVAQRALVMVHCTRQNTLDTIQTHHSSNAQGTVFPNVTRRTADHQLTFQTAKDLEQNKNK